MSAALKSAHIKTGLAAEALPQKREIELKSDCGRCAALCCVALPFDQSAHFAIDKLGAQPCPMLDTCGRCSIHAERMIAGFRGCVEFECFGAGQRVTQALFEGRSWIDQPALSEPMSRAFAITLRAHESLMLLQQAAGLNLVGADRERASALRDAMIDAGASEEKVRLVQHEILQFLKTLRDYVRAPSRSRD